MNLSFTIFPTCGCVFRRTLLCFGNQSQNKCWGSLQKGHASPGACWPKSCFWGVRLCERALVALVCQVQKGYSSKKLEREPKGGLLNVERSLQQRASAICKFFPLSGPHGDRPCFLDTFRAQLLTRSFSLAKPATVNSTFAHTLLLLDANFSGFYDFQAPGMLSP